ncbi:hypothetical protein CDAR_314671 [Caerostris darwini]|uniref:Chitin-binding type-2 domain-containing protein n=1 Tax=Caerostris darwini TaxID=1538125 RepID=A0AAV4TTA0_9ARAC|nr:hypothetical protein CDAR_314671 [Caerostris darwini]
MAMLAMESSKDKFIIILLLVILPAGYADSIDWRDHMEDAFGDEGQTGKTCERKSNDKFIFCRYQEKEKKSLPALNPCLCTHIILATDDHVSKMKIPNFLKSANGDLKILASVSVDANHHLNASNISKQIVSGLSDILVGGVDIRIENAVYLADESKTNFLKSIQQELSESIDSVLKTGLSKTKLLMPISLRRSIELVINESFTNEMYPKICHYIDVEGNNSQPLNHNDGENTNIIGVLKDQVKYALYKDVSGIDIWSLNDDDGYNACRKKPFPLMSEISNIFKSDKDSFDSFTDLDITLSTGESQISEEIQVLHERNTDPEEMKKFKCEKIGFYRHPSDCTKFYHCAEYRATTAQPESQHTIFVYQCPRGLVYDEHQGSCNWPSYSEPCEGSAELKPVPPKKFKCTIPGFHAHPVDCRWFYYCSDLGDGQLAAFEFLCPSQLLGFDEKNLLCNWKWMVPICENNSQDSYRPKQSNNANTDLSTLGRIPEELGKNKLAPESVSPTVITLKNHNKADWNPTPDNNDTNYSQTNDFKRKQINSVTGDTTSNITNLVDVLKRIAVSFVDYADTTAEISRQHNSELKNKSTNANVREKKYGTAYWHRSMINNPSQRNIPTVLHQHLQRTRNSAISYDDLPISKGIHENNNSHVENTYGIGRVRKLNVRPVENRNIRGDELSLNHKSEIANIFVESAAFSKENVSKNEEPNKNFHLNEGSYRSEAVRGRSVGENIATNYQFGNAINENQNQNPPNTNSHARVKCSKLIGENSDENTFGCTSEVSLFVRMKEGNEFKKYILSEDKITNSAYQESNQIKRLANNTSNFKQQNSSFENTTGRSTKEKQNRNSDENNSKPIFTQGRSVSSDFSSEVSNQRNVSLKFQALRLEDPRQNEEGNLLASSESENQNPDKNNFNKVNKVNSIFENNFQYSVRHDKQNEKETLTINSKTKIMPLSFYPQGVLLNVDLNHINEIPPQILLEVDIMLKKFMTGGDIDINLLMKKLNATMEHMPEAESNGNVTSNEIDSMINVLNNILNSTDNMRTQSTDENSMTNETESKNNISEANLTSDSYVETTTEELPYENITNSVNISNQDSTHNSEMNKNTQNTNTTNISTLHKNEKNIQTDEVIISQFPENKPFVRRRLFRKYKYPSIREQLEIQRLLASYNSSTQPSLPQIYTESSPESPKVVLNRSRYPSIKEQLLRNNNNVAFGHSRSLSSDETGTMYSQTTAYNDQNNYFKSSNDDNQFGSRIRPDGNDRIFEPNTRRTSVPAREEDNYRHPVVNLPNNKIPSNFRANTEFQSHNINGNIFQPNIATQEMKREEDNYKYPVANLPNNKIPSSFRENTEFQSHNINGNTFQPNIATQERKREEENYRHPVANLPNNRIPSSFRGNTEFQSHNINGNTFQPNIATQEMKREEDNYRHPVANLPNNRIPSSFRGNTEFRTYNINGNTFQPNFATQEVKSRHSPQNYDGSEFRNLPVDVSRFQYTLPIPPVSYATENPAVLDPHLPVNKINSFDRYDRGSVRYTTEKPSTLKHDVPVDSFNQFYSDSLLRGNTGNRRKPVDEHTQRRRKSRKLRILVKKVPNGEKNREGQFSQNDQQDNKQPNIPKKLLRELRTNLIKKLTTNGKSDVELQIQFQDHVWNIPFVNNKTSVDISPVACTRAGLFQHPKDCNMFYECFWDKWLRRFTLHVFSCPVKLVYDENIRGCSRPSFETPCRNSV